MRILAFETSCDDTAVAVTEAGHRVLGHATVSQAQSHSPYGGVVPELAARLHSLHWRSTVDLALQQASLPLEALDAVAVTAGPGLQTSLLIGTTAAAVIAQQLGVPLLPVHHIYGHILSNVCNRPPEEIVFPFLCLTVSGGHTQLHLVRSWRSIICLGTTLDDAAGECYDKTAKMLGLGYPGGPLVEQYAALGDPQAYALPTMLLESSSLDYSFSGLKGAIYRLVTALQVPGEPLPEQTKADICASLQHRMQTIFTTKVTRALERFPEVQQLHFVGGVSANKGLQAALQEGALHCGVPLLTPKKMLYCTDNAAMIGCSAHWRYLHEGLPLPATPTVQPLPRWELDKYL
ncbi:tRNA (adenosine(37)-N6)-threonylcarbamoyltransferase complex transferase subunit TsaD [Candidatus Peribacteria bacterium]|nr:tRNA (adenosine(37)-N6)-threonylcarbamoyltransferase complex transferase subunit TsaD [Candidatus Peribacteria bacterium]